MQLMAQMKRYYWQMIGAALLFGLIVGCFAGFGYWDKYGDRTTFYFKELPKAEQGDAS